MRPVFTRLPSLRDVSTHFCPGCQHGLVHRLVAEALDYHQLQQQTIGVASVGCSAFLYDYFDIDVVEAPHGRAPAVATGVKRALPDRVVFTYQGDGDLAAIGTGEIVHTAARGEALTVIFVNNTTYGMTGGQMAPTTLPGMKTTSSPRGRDVEAQGYPIRMAEMLATLDGAGYVVRRSLHDPANIRKAKKAIRIAFETQVHGLGVFDTSSHIKKKQEALRCYQEQFAAGETTIMLASLEAQERQVGEAAGFQFGEEFKLLSPWQLHIYPHSWKS